MMRIFGKKGAGSSDGPHMSGESKAHQKLIASMNLDDRHNVPFSMVEQGDLIGEGGFAKVKMCRVNGEEAVCKQIQSKKLDDETIYLLKNEVTIWAQLAHENIVSFLGMTSSDKQIWLLCEFMPDGSLFQRHERKRAARAALPSERELLDSMQQIASGMDYLHSLDPPVLHRDLKSPNILVHGSRLAIADFGLARYQERSDNQMTAETGSYRWMAPEVIRHEKYDAHCDVYSFAVLVWEMLTYSVPFEGMTPVEAAFAVAKHGKRPALPEGAPERITDVIKMCWMQDASMRPSFRKISKAIAEDTRASVQEDKGSKGEDSPSGRDSGTAVDDKAAEDEV